MELPLELQANIASYMTVSKIELSFPELLTYEYVWKMLFNRDFPCFLEFTPGNWDDYEGSYKHFRQFFAMEN